MDAKSKKRLKIAVWSIAGVVVLTIAGFAVVGTYLGSMIIGSAADVAFYTPDN